MGFPQFQKRATEIVEESKDNAQAEGARILTAAKAEVEQEAVRAREQLREKIAELAVAGASKILEREVDVAAHKDIVETVAKQIAYYGIRRDYNCPSLCGSAVLQSGGER